MSVATVFNFNSTSIVNLISIIIEQVLLYYLICINIKDQNTIECIIDIIIKISLVLSILGIIEYLLSFNIFALLDTSQRVIASYYVRMGNLRVSTSFKHSLGYGLYLVLILPIIMYRINSLNKNKKTLKYLLSVITFILVNINVILTSSRSTLLVLLLQYFILFVMSSWRKKVVTIIVSTILFIGVLSITLTPIGEKIPGVSTVSDNINSLVSLVTGENKTQDFGDNSEPFIYRNELIKYSLSKRGKELLVGDGLGFIREKPLIFNIPELNPWEPIVSYSVDNYYVLKFLEVGAIGLISIILLFLTYLKSMFLNRKKSYLSKMLLISIIGYLVNLFMVDELETIKYLWIVFAIFQHI
ncbi:O-antigen ligase family protein [Paraclostridium sp. AKS46]|nr:O-antigen ligase family protein [Paraclostridium sp. AKS46]